MTWLLWISALTILSGILYHLGGCGADGKKRYPFLPKIAFNPKIRDWGCAVCSLVAMPLVYHTSFGLKICAVYVATFLLTWGALSAYWKGKAEDMKAYHWFLHGLGIGWAAMPFILIGLPWWLISSRALILALTMMKVSVNTKDVQIEEIGRGALIIATETIFMVAMLFA